MAKTRKNYPPFDTPHWAIEDAACIGNFVIKAWFRDGSVREIDIEPLFTELKAAVYERLKYPDYFIQGRYDEELGTMVWPNGADFAPEFLYENGVEVQQRKMSSDR